MALKFYQNFGELWSRIPSWIEWGLIKHNVRESEGSTKLLCLLKINSNSYEDHIMEELRFWKKDR